MLRRYRCIVEKGVLVPFRFIASTRNAMLMRDAKNSTIARGEKKEENGKKKKGEK